MKVKKKNNCLTQPYGLSFDQLYNLVRLPCGVGLRCWGYHTLDSGSFSLSFFLFLFFSLLPPSPPDSCRGASAHRKEESCDIPKDITC